MVGRLANVLGQLRTNKLALLIGQPLDVLWEIRHAEEQDKSCHAGDAAFNDEDPSPAAVATVSAHL